MNTFPQRKSPRLQGYDYSTQGAYFVTICTHGRQHLFGDITEGRARLTAMGEIAAACWRAVPDHYPAVELDASVVMPNHVHGILLLHGDGGQFKTVLGRVINAYKGAVTARIRKQVSADVVIWQGRYHDHIVRSEASLHRIREYIMTNPQRWAEDTFGQ